MTEMKVPEVDVPTIYKHLKDDLTLCVKYHRRGKPEKVKEYFGTEERAEIEKQLQVICKPFSLIQNIQIERVIAELHNFYIQPEEK